MSQTVLTGRYQVINHLGGGGFGQTFLAKDLYLPGNPFCVVKQFKPQNNNPEFLATAKKLFVREAETLYKLGSHPRIPSLFAHFEQEDKFYLVQEYIEGTVLENEFFSLTEISENYIIDLLEDILTVLAFVHENNIIHRDIKPANLIRREQDGKIVLIDFGAVKDISNQINNPSGNSILTVAIGSPGYMPSEQQAFRPRLSSDIYAVGIVCLRALIGEQPQEFIEDLYTENFLKNLGISIGLESFLSRCIAYDHRQRYLNATEALRALRELKNFSQSNSKSTVFLTKNNPQAGAPTTSSIEAEFLARCRHELALIIGPFANFLIDDVLAKKKVLTPQELVDSLALEIPDAQEAKKFKANLF